MRSYTTQTLTGILIIDVQFGYANRLVQFAAFTYKTLSEHERWNTGKGAWDNGEAKIKELTLSLIANALEGRMEFDSIEQEYHFEFDHLYFYYRSSEERGDPYGPSIILGNTRKTVDTPGFCDTGHCTEHRIKWSVDKPGWPDAVIVAEFSAQEILEHGCPFHDAHLVRYHQGGS